MARWLGRGVRMGFLGVERWRLRVVREQDPDCTPMLTYPEKGECAAGRALGRQDCEWLVKEAPHFEMAAASCIGW